MKMSSFLKGLDLVRTIVGGSIIVMAIVGGAVLTPMMGLIAQAHRISIAYLVQLVCYFVIAFYSFAGHRLSQRSGGVLNESATLATASQS